MTAVLGHVNERDFGEAHRKWHSCEPFALFDAEIVTGLSSVSTTCVSRNPAILLPGRADSRCCLLPSAPLQDMKPVVANLKRLARDHDLLVIWTDCDREGEHIGAEVLGHCKLANPQIRCLRAKFSAIIPASVALLTSCYVCVDV